MAPPILIANELTPGDGDLFGHYRIGRALGSGAMANVFEAVDVNSGQFVAVKVLRANRAGTSEVVARFIREGRALAKMNHPNIVRVLEHDTTADGTPWIAMERLDGQPLDALIRENERLTLERALRLAIDVATALSVVHARGMVHRDVKPENVFVTDVGTASERAKLIDFGVAHVTGEDLGENSVAYTHSGSLLGTVAFMPTEQFQGHEATPASDVFSLAVTLYEMLTGAFPFDGTGMKEQFQARQSNRHVPMQKRVKLLVVPPALEVLLARALANDPRERPSDGATFGRALGALLASLQTSGSEASSALLAMAEAAPAMASVGQADAPNRLVPPAPPSSPAMPPGWKALAPAVDRVEWAGSANAASPAETSARTRWIVVAVVVLAVVAAIAILVVRAAHS
jgi:serine/threonine-protein kinase